MGTVLDNVTAGVTTNPIGSATGIAGLFGPSHKKRTERQIEAQNKMNEDAARTNFKYGEMAAESAFERQLGLFDYEANYNSPKAQKERLEAAGLSPALMYGQAGTTGTTSASTAPQGAGAGSQQGGRAANAAEQQAARTQSLALMLGAAKVRSEIDLNEAGAEEKRANAQYTGGAQTQSTMTNIALVTEQIENAKVQRKGMEIQNDFNDIQKEIAESTKELEIKKIEYDVIQTATQLDIINQELRRSEIETDIKEKTWETIIKTYENQLVAIIQDVAVKKAQEDATRKGIELTEVEIGALRKRVENETYKIDIEAGMMEGTLESWRQDRINALWTAGIGAVGSIVGTAAGATIIKAIPKRKTNPIGY